MMALRLELEEFVETLNKDNHESSLNNKNDVETTGEPEIESKSV